ncbi:MAG: Resolvase domain protein [Dactylosporangium sp.]|jgi:hypothetical protein|nr:Resolvase domain protein [Dactylosporangium sp.]
MRAAVYLRISDDRDGRELDVERQRADCLKLAGRLGVDVVEVYQDNDAEASARVHQRRPAYRRMLADAGQRRFGTVIAYTSGRLVHLPEEYEDLIELAQRHGTRFAYVMSASSYPNTRDDPPSASPLLPIVSVLDTFRRLAGDLAPDLKGLVADAAPVIEPLAEGVAGFVRNAMPGLRGMVRESAPFVSELSRSLPPLGHALGRFFSSVSPGAPGASAFASDVITLASGQAVFWGDVVRRMSQAYLTVRGLVGDLDEAFAALPQRTRRLVVSLFDQATTAIGIGIGTALRSGAELPDHTRSTLGYLRERLASTVDGANAAASAVVDATADVLVNLPGRVARTAGDLAGSVRTAATWVSDEGQPIARRLVSDAGFATAGIAAAAVDRAVHNILVGMKSGLQPARTADEVVPWIRSDGVVATNAIPVEAAAAPAGITVNGLNINLYGMWDLSDSATFDRVAAGVYEALNRYRQEYA